MWATLAKRSKVEPRQRMHDDGFGSEGG